MGWRGGVTVLGVAAMVAACGGAGSVAPNPSSDAPSGSPAAAGTNPLISEATANPTEEAPGIRILVLGDSIALKEMGCGDDCDGFDELFGRTVEQRTGKKVLVTNLARGNARVGTLLQRLDESPVAKAVTSADVVIVSIGYNDEPPRTEADAPCRVEDPPPDDDGSATIKAALTYTNACIDATMDWYEPSLDGVYGTIEELAAGRPQVRVTLGVFNNWIGHPAFDAVELPEREKQRAMAISIRMKDAWNERDCAVAKAHGFVCGDLYHAFNGPNGDQPIEPYVVGDYVHLNAEGHAKVASLLDALPLDALP